MICKTCKTNYQCVERSFSLSKRHKSGFLPECKKCFKNRLKSIKKEKPWLWNLWHAKSRCICPSNTKYPFYGARGIRCLLSEDEIKFMWIRDSANKMNRPTIDRINPDGHYVFTNCRFLEMKENSGKRRNPYTVSGRLK